MAKSKNEKIMQILKDVCKECDIYYRTMKAWGKEIQADFVKKNTLAGLSTQEIQLAVKEKVGRLEGLVHSQSKELS
jgi:porphobilinogen deaminase